MFTRISKAYTALAVLALVPGCVTGLQRDETGGAPSQAIVTSDAVVVTGPSGFCVDDSATRAENDTAFVLLGNCAAISNSRRAVQPDVPVVLTAAISEASDGGSISESLADLDTFFRSEEGLTLLSRSQDPESVEVLETYVEADQFLIHASDSSTGAMEGVADDYWRSYFDLGARIATLSVFALEGETVTREDSLAALQAFAQSVRSANVLQPDPVAPTAEVAELLGETDAEANLDAGVAATQVPTEPQLTAEPRGGLFNVGLFRRVFE